MPDGYRRLIAANRNRLVQSCGSLLGLATGLLADKHLNDAEVRFLHDWLTEQADITGEWPGDVLHSRVKNVLADGIVTEEERAHLVDTLTKICGGTLEANVSSAVNQMAFDEAVAIQFQGSAFCVTGEFVYGPRERVCSEIATRGGEVVKGVTKKLNYLVVGLQGSEEWKHGSYGTKIVKAMEYKKNGLPIYIVREDIWTAALQ
jgi:NAD-dependent DNA ligase